MGGGATVDEVEDEAQAAAPRSSRLGLKPLDPLERRVAFAVAMVAVVGSIALWAAMWVDLARLWLPVDLFFAAVLAYASQRLGRLGVGVAAFLLSFSVWPVPLVGLPFLLLGLWLWFRGRPSPEEIEQRRAERTAAMEAKRRAKRGEPEPVRKAPPQSKRYTPPASRKR